MLSTNWKVWDEAIPDRKQPAFPEKIITKGLGGRQENSQRRRLWILCCKNCAQFTRGKCLQMLLGSQPSQTKWHSDSVQKLQRSGRIQFWEVVKGWLKAHAIETLTAGSKMLSRERLWTEFVDKRQWLLKFWWRLEFNSTISQTFLFLSGWKLQGKVSQRCWSCPSSRQWSINSTHTKNAYNCRCNRGFTWCSEMRSETIHWFGLRAMNCFITYEGKNALITAWRIRGVCYDSMGRNNTVIRAGKK